MRIRIRHQTDYAYSEPIRSGVQYLRMRPRSGPTQAVQDWRVTAPGSLTQWIDHVGNICHTLTIEHPAGIISVVVAGVVETFEGNGVMPMDEDEPPVEVFLRDSPYTGLDDRLRDLAETHRAAVEADRLDGLHALMRGVTEAVEYREGETHAHTTAAEALANGFGVCQDHAHVYIAACRVLGVPARYVSGYLCTGAPSITPQVMPGPRRRCPSSAGSASIPRTASRRPRPMCALPPAPITPVPARYAACGRAAARRASTFRSWSKVSNKRWGNPMSKTDKGAQADRSPEAFLDQAYGLHSLADAMAFYSDWAEDYDDQMEQQLGYVAPRLMAERVAAWMPERSAAVLDVGCGTGLTGQYLFGLGFETIDGIDFNPNMIAKARERGIYRRLVEADITRPLEIEDAAYDAIMSSGTFTIGHVGSEPLDEIQRILKPGGVFGCTIHTDIWEPKGFNAKFAAFEAAGLLDPVDRVEGEFFTGLGRKALYCVFRKP